LEALAPGNAEIIQDKTAAIIMEILTQPTIVRETAWVQIKSGTSQAGLDDYLSPSAGRQL
jgi:hypothetical protein